MALLTSIQRTWLEWLNENGGSAWVDQYGRLVANGAQSKQGTQVAWLHLIAKGMVHVVEQRFVLTDQGRQTIGARDNGS